MAKTEGGRVIVPESFDKDVKHDLIKVGTAKDPHTGKALMRGMSEFMQAFAHADFTVS